MGTKEVANLRLSVIDELEPLNGRQRHPFETEIRGVVAGQTRFGNFIQPLLTELSKVPKITESKETFEAVYGFLKDKNLADMEFTRDDILFLLTTQAGNLIRRPMLHTAYAHKAERIVDARSEEANAVKGILLSLSRGAAWSKFIEKSDVLDHIAAAHPNDEIFIDYARAREDIINSAGEPSVSKTAEGTINILGHLDLLEKESIDGGRDDKTRGGEDIRCNLLSWGQGCHAAVGGGMRGRHAGACRLWPLFRRRAHCLGQGGLLQIR